MKRTTTRKTRRRASALVAVLTFSFILLLSTTALISFGVHKRMESARLTLYNAELSTAENALNSLVAQFDFMGRANPPQVTQGSQNLEDFIYSENGLLQAMAGKDSDERFMDGHPGFIVTAAIEPLDIPGLDDDTDSVAIDEDIIDLVGENDLRQWMGFNINLSSYRIVAGARAYNDNPDDDDDPGSGMALADSLKRPGVYVGQTVSFYRVPLLNYAIFYQNTLELDAGQQIDVYGKVHTNSDWYLTSSSRANYHSSVTVAGNFYGGVYHPGDQRRGRTNSANIYLATEPPDEFGGENNANLRQLRNTGTTSINQGYLSSSNYNNQWNDNRYWSDNPDWVDDANRYYKGMIRDADHGIEQVRLPINEQDSPRMILEPPVVASDPEDDDRADSGRLENKLAYQASIILETRSGWDDPDNFSGDGIADLNNYVEAYRRYPVLSSDGESVEWEYEGPFSVVYTDGTDADADGEPDPKTFLDYTRIYDGRERHYVNMLDLNMGQLANYLNTSNTILDGGGASGRFNLDKPGAQSDGSVTNISATDPGVIYVNPRQDSISRSGETAATRVVNARDLSGVIANSGAVEIRGLTVATDAPLYSKGDINAPSSGDSVPMLMAGDSIHILSNQFSDSQYGRSGLSGGGPNRDAAPTETNAVFLAGNVPTIHKYLYDEDNDRWYQNPDWSSSLGYSGGGENYFRYLESWGGDDPHTFRGSILNLFESRYHTGRWGVGGYYGPPRRNWGWDPAFASGQTPPGMPRSWNVTISNWEVVSPDAVTDVGEDGIAGTLVGL